jgi:hypothetical protein
MVKRYDASLNRTAVLCASVALACAWLYACDGGKEELTALMPASEDARAPLGSDAMLPQRDGSVACGASQMICCEQGCNDGLACKSGLCVSAIAPVTCAAGAPAWSFVSETALPASMTPYQRATISLTFRNCSGAAVGAASNLKLGFSAPRDYDTFGVSRIALPADVPNASDVTFTTVLRAPPLTGTHAAKWGLVDEGRAWLNVESPLQSVSVQVAPSMATICPGVSADIGGGASASAALQTCVNQTSAGGVLEIPSGIYRLTSELRVNNAITLRTAGTTAASVSCWDRDSTACAVLRADDNLVAARGMFFVAANSGVNVDRIVIDGNRASRIASAAGVTCASGNNNGAGFNAHSDNCQGCSFTRGVSARALCGSGWEWVGEQATITNNVFIQNGDHNTKNMWSDGLTLLGSNGAIVKGNYFIDNSDIDFICGGATNAMFESNRVTHAQQATFGGIMLDNFNGGTTGNFIGTVVKNNTIGCGDMLCDFGMVLGPHSWYLSANIQGGTVTGNAIVGARIQINAEGAGTAANPLVASGNILGPTVTNAKYWCGQTHPATPFNVSPDSFVTTADATGHFAYHVCP